MSPHEWVMRDDEEFCFVCRRPRGETLPECVSATCELCDDPEVCLDDGCCLLLGTEL